MDGVLVQEVLEPNGERSIGYEKIDPEIERGVTYVLISTVEKLDERSS